MNIFPHIIHFHLKHKFLIFFLRILRYKNSKWESQIRVKPLASQNKSVCVIIRLYFLQMPKEFVLQMKQEYPFGELSGIIAEGTNALVKKILHYQNEEQFDTISSMVHFIRVAKHERLVNISKVLHGQSRIELYYEYAPLKLQRWLVNINEGIVHQLQNQLLELTQFLTRSSIKFQFDPLSIGLGEDLSMKYFLNKFSIDMENQEQNYEQIEQEIKHFFKELQARWSIEQQVERDRENPIKISVNESLSTTGSISNIEELINLDKQTNHRHQKDRFKKTPEKYGLKSHLSEKVQSSKKKCLQAMDRFRKLAEK